MGTVSGMPDLAEYAPGTRVGGRYRVVRTIGRGGMSIVYLVEDIRLGTRWAMKTAGRIEDEGGRICRQSIAAEISVLRRIHHPGLPRIVDVIEEDNTISIIMDYIEGRTLLDIIEKEGPQNQETAVRWALFLTDVLACLHRETPPIIYRDMKPGNVILTNDGRLVLFDFGIAREYKASGTQDTVCLGTVGYAAPEQFGGSGQTDERTDMYGLGATLYHLVTGNNPAKPPYEMVPVRNIRPELSAGLEEIILRCTRRNPGERFRNCGELTEALENYRLLDRDVRKREMRKLVIFLISSAAAVFFFVLGTALFFRIGRERRDVYAAALSRAGDLAAASLTEERYDPEVLRHYIEAIEISPASEEAYLNLLDYSCDIGETASGLSVICPRIDAGCISEKNCRELIYRVAELYFSGNEGDGAFRRDYRKAAKYFSMIDTETCPEAGECADLASALGVFGRDVDFKKTGESLLSFAERCRRKTVGERRIRNLLLGADLWMTNRAEFENAGYEASLEAKILLKDALQTAETSQAEGSDMSGYMMRILSGLASVCRIRPGESEEAIGWYGQMILLAGDEGRIREIRKKEAETAAYADLENADELFLSLLADYPEDADIWVDYCSYLLKNGDRAGAERMLDKGQEHADLSSGKNYGILCMKLKEDA